MRIVAVIKQTFDTEEKVVVENGRILDEGVKWVINPYDEYAIEEAVRLKERHGGTVIAVTAGPERAEQALRTALAMGADRAVRIECEETDEFVVARLLAAYIRREGADLVLAGNMSVDRGAAQVGPRLAEELGIPHIAAVTRLSLENGKAVAVRDEEGDAVTLEAGLPLLVTAQQGLNEPRYPSLPSLMKARKMPIGRMRPEELDAEAARSPKTVVVGLAAAPGRRGVCRMLPGTPEEQAKELAWILAFEEKAVY